MYANDLCHIDKWPPLLVGSSLINLVFSIPSVHKKIRGNSISDLETMPPNKYCL